MSTRLTEERFENYLDEVYALVKKRILLAEKRLAVPFEEEAVKKLQKEIHAAAECLWDREKEAADRGEFLSLPYLLSVCGLLPFERHVIFFLVCHALRPECREVCRSLNSSGSPFVTEEVLTLCYEEELTSEKVFLNLERNSVLGRYYLTVEGEHGTGQRFSLSERLLHLIISGEVKYPPYRDFLAVYTAEESEKELQKQEETGVDRLYYEEGVLSFEEFSQMLSDREEIEIGQFYGASGERREAFLYQLSKDMSVPIIGLYLNETVWGASMDFYDASSESFVRNRILLWLRECVLWNGVPAVMVPENCPQGFLEELARFVSEEAEWRQGLWKEQDRKRPVLLILTERERILKNQMKQCVSFAIAESPIGKAKRVPLPFGLEDIVLPKLQKKQIRDACAQVRFKKKVYQEWGMEKIVAYGKGVSILFFGPPGTGKTMAAQIVAAELGMELYRVSLPAVVSKYIGETEKNLDEIFEQAGRRQIVLFFDEADVLFGKRTEIKDSNDKYSNMEAAFLLQKMEEYEGVTILATNYRKNFDEAFSRRMKFVIDFPFPEKEERKEIWKRSIPEKLFAGELDLEYLSERFELSGSNIKNIILHAAFLTAAAGDECLTMPVILEAVKHEYGKLGKVISDHELFGDFMGG